MKIELTREELRMVRAAIAQRESRLYGLADDTRTRGSAGVANQFREKAEAYGRLLAKLIQDGGEET